MRCGCVWLADVGPKPNNMTWALEGLRRSRLAPKPPSHDFAQTADSKTLDGGIDLGVWDADGDLDRRRRIGTVEVHVWAIRSCPSGFFFWTRLDSGTAPDERDWMGTTRARIVCGQLSEVVTLGSDWKCCSKSYSLNQLTMPCSTTFDTNQQTWNWSVIKILCMKWAISLLLLPWPKNIRNRGRDRHHI